MHDNMKGGTSNVAYSQRQDGGGEIKETAKIIIPME